MANLFNDINSAWSASGEATKKKVKDYEDVPDGDYTVFVDRVTLKSSKAGNPMLSWMFRVMDDPFGGRCLFKNSMAATVKTDPNTGEKFVDIEKTMKNQQFLKADLAACGLSDEEIASCNPLIGQDENGDLTTGIPLDSLVGRAMAVRKVARKTDTGTFDTIYMNRYLGSREDVRKEQSTQSKWGTEKRFDDEDILF